MAKNRRSSGQRFKYLTASGNITSGDFVAQEGFFGVALDTVLSGSPGWLALEGEWKIAVPASTVIGDILYAPATAGVITESATAITLSRTSATTNVPIGKASSDRDAAGFANVFLGAQVGARAGQQA